MPNGGYPEQDCKNACGSQGGLVVIELDRAWIYRHYDDSNCWSFLDNRDSCLFELPPLLLSGSWAVQ